MPLMKRHYLFFVPVFLLLCNDILAQRISTSSSLPLENLSENNEVTVVLRSQISSAVNGSINNLDSFGFFEKAGSNFPFEDGVILSTGSVASAGNTEINLPLDEGEDNWLGDADLEAALGISTTINATSIQFDFILVGNQVEFNYIFASEEYFGTNPCDFSDSFVILIKKAGTTDNFTNIALVQERHFQ